MVLGDSSRTYLDTLILDLLVNLGHLRGEIHTLLTLLLLQLQRNTTDRSTGNAV